MAHGERARRLANNCGRDYWSRRWRDTMPDIIDEIDALHAKATPGPLETHGIVGHIEIVSMRSHMAPIVPVARCYSTSCDGPSGAPTFREAMVNADIIVALVNHWPAISARLREAERHMSALAAINTGLVGIGRNGTNYRQWCAWRQTHGGTDGPTAISEDLLTAIETAIAAGKETT